MKILTKTALRNASALASTVLLGLLVASSLMLAQTPIVLLFPRSRFRCLPRRRLR